MKTSSAKQKGRKLQQMVRDLILKAFPSLQPEDCRSCSMGSQGEDVQLSPAARAVFPYSTECKNQERLNVWESLKQAEANATDGTVPLLIIKRNHTQPYAIIPLEHFMTLVGPDEVN